MNFKFYEKILEKYIKNREASILVIAAGKNDFLVFSKLGFKNVTFSNLDESLNFNTFLPYKWSKQNAESLTFENNQFDYVIEHEGLHHCFSPHKALLEMYRVSKKGILCIESSDNFLMRFCIKFKLAYQYEINAVIGNNFLCGGAANTEIPNYVYRWNENEIKKTINCYAPYSDHKIYYDYDLNLPINLKKNLFLKFIFNIIGYILKIALPKQLNLFSFFIIKPNLFENSFEWISLENKEIRLDKNWINRNSIKK